MALSANTVWEVRTAGNDTNGGGFVSGASGNDYSLQDSKNTVGSDISTTDAVANGTTTITSATANFGTTIVGNIIYFAGGTGTITGVWRQCTARASTTSITIDASIAASTGMTMNIGGALLSPAIASFSAVSGNLIFIKNGTYSITSASTNVAAGCISLSAAPYRIVGYSSTRTFGNTDTKPVLQLNVAAATLISANQAMCRNLTFDGNAQTTSLLTGGSTTFIFCLIKNFTSATTGAICAIDCEFSGWSAAAIPAAGLGFGCNFHGNSATPMSGSGFGCISYGNTGGSTDGFAPGTSARLANCTAYGNGRAGFNSGSPAVELVNCLSESNVGNGFDRTATNVSFCMINCAHFGNAAGVGANITSAQQINTIALSSSALNNPGGNDFSLNNTASAGASCRHAGYPTTFMGASTNQFLDIGAAEPGGFTTGTAFTG